MPKTMVTPMRAAADAVAVLGDQIRLARHTRNWTAAELADRIGVSKRTVAAIETGRPGVAIGTVFNAAVAVGIDLFGADQAELARLRREGRERLALIPSRVYHPRRGDNPDDFDF